jgi:hypothetical protein
MSKMNWKNIKKCKINTPEDSRARQAAYEEKQWLKKQLKEVEAKLRKIEGKKFKPRQNTHRELIGLGYDCPKCGKSMKRYEHGKEWVPRPNSYYFEYWDICERCKHIQHYECAKMYVDDEMKRKPSTGVLWGDKWED